MPMPLFLQLNHALFLVCLGVHCVLALSVFWLSGAYLWHRRRALAAEKTLLAQALPSAVPHVLVQLPTFNESALIRRVAKAVGALHWPADRLHVQILDDSTDDSVVDSRTAVESLRQAGIDTTLVARAHRSGFKGGALAEGLCRSREEYVAILDADYVPDPDFLQACMKPMLADSSVAFVQARCDYLNADENVMTRAEQRLLDAHFAVEQAARNWSGQVTPFNGTCGVWRRCAIDAAGGWQGDTLAEDLDLSYRAQMLGWRAVFLATIGVKGELPGSRAVWQQQQFRWTKGFAEAARKLLWRVWCSRLTPGQKLVSTFHLGGGILGPLFAVTVATGTVDLIFGYGVTPLAVSLMAFSLLGGALLGPSLLILLAQIFGRGANLADEIPRLPGVLALQVSTGLANLGGAIDALAGRATAFERTPKGGATATSAPKSYAPGSRP